MKFSKNRKALLTEEDALKLLTKKLHGVNEVKREKERDGKIRVLMSLLVNKKCDFTKMGKANPTHLD